MKISVIVPTYNESAGILAFLRRLKKVLNRLKKNYSSEIIIVDDNSPDETTKIIKEKYRNDNSVKVLIRKGGRNLGRAIGLGIQKAKGEIIVGMDGDGNHPPEKIPFLIKEMKNYDLIQASRFIKGGGIEKTTDCFRHLASLSLNSFFKILGFPIWDSTCGFYAVRKKKLKILNLKKIYYGYGEYHLRLVYYAQKNQFLIKEIPFIYKKRIAGMSKSNLVKMFFSISLKE
jgi:dolichol-phosphate mannosyltransferase